MIRVRRSRRRGVCEVCDARGRVHEIFEIFCGAVFELFEIDDALVPNGHAVTYDFRGFGGWECWI